ncbi:MAG TPA: hypothetical protein VF183_07325 [Acidimicrobiales bacterium]
MAYRTPGAVGPAVDNDKHRQWILATAGWRYDRFDFDDQAGIAKMVEWTVDDGLSKMTALVADRSFGVAAPRIGSVATLTVHDRVGSGIWTPVTDNTWTASGVGVAELVVDVLTRPSYGAHRWTELDACVRNFMRVYREAAATRGAF